MAVLAETKSSIGEGRVSRVISYKHYQELGGILNETDHRRALETVGQTVNPYHKAQAEHIAGVSGIPNLPESVVRVYDVLRGDLNVGGVESHYAQMSDQCDHRVLAEALRVLGLSKLLIKVIEKHPNICLYNKARPTTPA